MIKSSPFGSTVLTGESAEAFLRQANVSFFPGTSPCVTAAELAEQLISAERQVNDGTATLDTELDSGIKNLRALKRRVNPEQPKRLQVSSHNHGPGECATELCGGVENTRS